MVGSTEGVLSDLVSTVLASRENGSALAVKSVVPCDFTVVCIDCNTVTGHIG